LLLAAAAVASPSCPVANGATGWGTPIRDVVTRIAERLGLGTNPRFSGVVRAGDPPHYVGDIGEATAWGWSPHHDLVSGLDAYVDWYREDTL
jgi:UDP-glucose 4-epimerase